MAGDLDAAGLDRLQAVDAAQQRALARAAAADDGDDLAPLDLSETPFRTSTCAEALVDVLNEHGWHASPFRVAAEPRQRESRCAK